MAKLGRQDAYKLLADVHTLARNGGFEILEAPSPDHREPRLSTRAPNGLFVRLKAKKNETTYAYGLRLSITPTDRDYYFDEEPCLIRTPQKIYDAMLLGAMRMQAEATAQSTRAEKWKAIQKRWFDAYAAALADAPEETRNQKRCFDIVLRETQEGNHVMIISDGHSSRVVEYHFELDPFTGDIAGPIEKKLFVPSQTIAASDFNLQGVFQ